MSNYTINPPFWVTKCGECGNFDFRTGRCQRTGLIARYDDEICFMQKAHNIVLRQSWEAEKRKYEAEKGMTNNGDQQEEA